MKNLKTCLKEAIFEHPEFPNKKGIETYLLDLLDDCTELHDEMYDSSNSKDNPSLYATLCYTIACDYDNLADGCELEERLTLQNNFYTELALIGHAYAKQEESR